MAIDIIDYNKRLGEIPEPLLRKKWIETYEEMSVHTAGASPQKLLDTRRPNESQEIRDYRVSIYQPITKSSINRAIDQLYRIFLNTNFSIKTSEDSELYLSTKRYNRKPFLSYIQIDVLKRMIEDPNGFLIWLPAGAGLVDPSEKVEVEPRLVLSADVVFASEDVFSYVAHGNKRDGSRRIISIDDTAIYIHTELKKRDTFSVELLYTHNLGTIPAIKLGGNIIQDPDTDGEYLESYFSPYLPFANEAIRQYSDWTAIMVTSAYPFREEISEECDGPACQAGQILKHDSDGNEDFHNCPRCNGTGLKKNKSPYGVFQRARQNSTMEQIDARPSVSFIAPPTDIIQYSQSAWEGLLKKAEEALHLKFIEEAQSGVAKILDRENQYSFLSKVCATIFDGHIKQSLWFIERYRNISQPTDPRVIKPSNFTVKSEQDLVNEITELKSKNAPSPFIVEATKDLSKRRFSGDDKTSRLIDIVVAYDPLFHLTIDEKSRLLAAGGITSEDIVRSTHAYAIINEIVLDEGDRILELSIAEVKQRIEAKLQPILAAQRPTTLFP